MLGFNQNIITYAIESEKELRLEVFGDETIQFIDLNTIEFEVCSLEVGVLGEFDPDLNKIKISRILINSYSDKDIIDVIKHELIHCYVFNKYGKDYVYDESAVFQLYTYKLGVIYNHGCSFDFNEFLEFKDFFDNSSFNEFEQGIYELVMGLESEFAKRIN